jgi:hypothetical protein
MVAKAGVCTAVKDDGSPCQARAQSKSSFCVFHDPDAEELRRTARRNGGVNRNRPAVVLDVDTPDPRLNSVHDVAGLLADTICRVRKGGLDPRVANTIGYLAGIMIRALEGADLEQRLADLEEAVRVSRMRPAGFDPSNPPMPEALVVDEESP